MIKDKQIFVSGKLIEIFKKIFKEREKLGNLIILNYSSIFFVNIYFCLRF